MITPLDIEKKEFSKGVRGYKEDEVDEFLDLIIIDMEKLLLENKKLKKLVEDLNQEVLRNKSCEKSVLQTLEAAKTLMTDISASAERRAEVLLKNAQMDA
ncbi:MAG: DivIVA domain-containing protein, partial [Eubacteriales bacterium]|nr:DivIVA domain-containing protein [Eubacteriales bacterium]